MHCLRHDHQLRPRGRSRGGAAVRRHPRQWTAESPPRLREEAFPAWRIGLGLFLLEATGLEHLGYQASAVEVAVGFVCAVCGKKCAGYPAAGDFAGLIILMDDLAVRV